MKIIYDNNEGGVSVLHLTDTIPLSEVVQKDVPAGAAYRIVEDGVVPSDRSFRNAWEADFSKPDGYGIGADAWSAAKAAAEAAAEAGRLAAEEAAAKQTVDAPAEEVTE